MKSHILFGRVIYSGLFIAVTCTSVNSHSQTQPSTRDQQIQEKFKAADKNHDGKLTLDEAKAGMPRIAANFNKIDVQKKGYVTEAEIVDMANK